MAMLNITIDGQQMQVPEGITVLEAARMAGIKIPTLCYLKDINEMGACRVCLVEIERARGLQPSCMYPVMEGMVVRTNTPAIREARKAVVELILSNHPMECLTCDRNTNCELQALAKQFGITDVRFQGENTFFPQDTSSPSIVRNPDKCILCRRCVSVCNKVQGVGVLGVTNRGFESIVAPSFDHQLNEVDCVYCGQCVNVCPVGALTEKDDTQAVWDAINDPEKVVVVQTAPAVRAALGEEFGYPIGTSVTGKMVAALRRLGFDKVFDTDFTADLTILEEGNELLERVKNGGKLPLITSCSPGWVKFCEHNYPEFLDNLSTAKSPQQMFGALAKTYYAKKCGVDPEKIFSVSIMPCTAKKFERQRPEMKDSGFADVDAVLTTRELAKMIKMAGIDLQALPDEKHDEPMGISTGAGLIFGATGGVMEAALRTVYEVVTGKTLKKLDFVEVRGLEGVKEASVEIPPLGTVKIAVAHGLGNARKVLDKVKAGEADYHFIEIMACPGGCVGGGGQPIVSAQTRMDLKEDYRALRAKAIYEEDKGMPMRKSHENPAVITLYEEFLVKPLGEKSHHLLHTHYTARVKNQALADACAEAKKASAQKKK
ncbi:MAG TPA: NADH-dependent [FeFe] hydrogenase, group A6 [Peptococcaceae bacterium]|jgi:NADP-reducing hydrogenase subunit HndD|nr:4Fe-4S binding protein [Clostridia bacterium]HOB82038.1 NADH-dependent [FeFe] hydrogenase, group A6 [Peptococcaceae bacterium]HPZ70874.1 NADH-dependent [FeFe] hydrogenase, group A6 [Peptococcaceae bacterium]HQD54220.1 NADH-dependent [FeFe] hydrogenase, group A6 [Peptococcaceae bacterium]